MGILGIENRTENWKTAYYFSPFFRNAAARLDLAKRLGAMESTLARDVHLQLFWKGARDHLKQNRDRFKEIEDYHSLLASHYQDQNLFSDLSERIEKFRTSVGILSTPNQSYDSSDQNWCSRLGNNLINTEIDIVLDAPGYLFIGEAKHKSGFGRDGNLFIVHQLIRQYVMAKILVECWKVENEEADPTKKVVPFVVCDDRKKVLRVQQVKFMIEQKWLRSENVLSWEDIKVLTNGA